MSLVKVEVLIQILYSNKSTGSKIYSKCKSKKYPSELQNPKVIALKYPALFVCFQCSKIEM